MLNVWIHAHTYYAFFIIIKLNGWLLQDKMTRRYRKERRRKQGTITTLSSRVIVRGRYYIFQKMWKGTCENAKVIDIYFSTHNCTRQLSRIDVLDWLKLKLFALNISWGNIELVKTTQTQHKAYLNK